MKKFIALTLCLFAVASPSFGLSAEGDPASAPAPSDIDQDLKYAQGLSQAFERVASKITPSVVNVSSTKKGSTLTSMNGRPGKIPDQLREFFGDDFLNRLYPEGPPQGYSQQGLGTGVVVDEKGLILTNNHVVAEADEVVVKLSDGRSLKAKIVGTDPRTDLAVIKVNADHLAAAKLGDSDTLKIGEWVVAAGNPFGLDNTITAGIVSAKGRSIVGGGQYEDFIQTDAAINPGNSGGPLLNLKGEVVGINTAIFSRSGGYMGIGFAIPSEMAKTVMNSLIKSGKVTRGWLGIGIQPLTEDLAQSFNYPSTDGILVGHVDQAAPAGKAGVKQGDIIIALNGDKILNTNQFRNKIAATAPGQSVDLDLIRDGRKQTLAIKIGELPAQMPGEREPANEHEESQTAVDIGISIETLTPELAARLGVKNPTGVIVSAVQPGSLAADATIQPRDIIVSVNGEEINGAADFKKLVTKSAVKKGIRLVIETQGMERFVILKSSN